MVNCPVCGASEKLLAERLEKGKWKCLTCGTKFTIEGEEKCIEE